MGNLSPDKLKIGRALLAGGPISRDHLQRELERSGKQESVLGKALLQSGFPTEDELVSLLLQRLRIPKINASNTKIPLETVRLLPKDVAVRCRALPIDQIGRIMVVVTPDIGNDEALAEVRKATGSLVTPIQCAAEGFDGIVQDYYRRLAEAGLEPVQAVSTGSGAHATGTNGVVQAIPAGPDHEDTFWRLYQSAGPIPASEVRM
jgi:hypothetical protein